MASKTKWMLSAFVLLALLAFSTVHMARSQDSVQEKMTRNQQPQQGLTVAIPCNGRELILAYGGDTPIDLTFVMNDSLSGCFAQLDCPDVADDPRTIPFPPGNGTAVFACQTGRIRLTSLIGSGNLMLEIGGAN